MLGPSGDGLGHSSPLEARPVPAWRQPTCASAPACMRPGVSWDKCCWFSRDLEWNEGQAKFVALETMSRTQVGQGLLVPVFQRAWQACSGPSGHRSSVWDALTESGLGLPCTEVSFPACPPAPALSPCSSVSEPCGDRAFPREGRL